MKTTMELPDHLMRRVKMRAVQGNRKLKDVIAELLECGLSGKSGGEVLRTRPPTPVRLKTHRLLSIEEIESAIASGRD